MGWVAIIACSHAQRHDKREKDSLSPPPTSIYKGGIFLFILTNYFMPLDCDRKPSEQGYELECNGIGSYPLQYKLLDMISRVGLSELQLVDIILERFVPPFQDADFPQLVNIILEQNFPFLADDTELRDLVLNFLC